MPRRLISGLNERREVAVKCVIVSSVPTLADPTALGGPTKIAQQKWSRIFKWFVYESFLVQIQLNSYDDDVDVGTGVDINSHAVQTAIMSRWWSIGQTINNSLVRYLHSGISLYRFIESINSSSPPSSVVIIIVVIESLHYHPSHYSTTTTEGHDDGQVKAQCFGSE